MKIGQFRRGQQNFQEEIKYLLSFEEEDLIMSIENDVFKENHIYCLDGGKLNIPSKKKCTIKLSDGKYQMIVGQTSNLVNLSFVPNKNYPYLIFSFESNEEKEFIEIPILYELKNLCENEIPNKIKQIGIQGTPGLKFSINREDFTMGKSGIFTMNEIDIIQIGFLIREFDKTRIENEHIIDYINYFPYVTDGNEFFIMDYMY